MEISLENDPSASLERLCRADSASADGAEGDTDVDVTAELEAELLPVSGVPSAPLLNILSKEILPLMRLPLHWSASEPADLGRCELAVERLDGRLLRCEVATPRGTSST